LIQRPAPFQTIIALFLGSGPVKGGLISPPIPESETTDAPRHHSRSERTTARVDFGDAPVRVEIYASGEIVEIFIEADSDMLPQERRRFALLNIPRHLFSEATAAAARRAADPVVSSRRADS
jgi:hypothetical protein